MSEPRANTSMRWRVSIADGDRLIHHAVCEDLKECQAIATEARHNNMRWKIWITPPAGPAYPWD